MHQIGIKKLHMYANLAELLDSMLLGCHNNFWFCTFQNKYITTYCHVHRTSVEISRLHI